MPQIRVEVLKCFNEICKQFSYSFIYLFTILRYYLIILFIKKQTRFSIKATIKEIFEIVQKQFFIQIFFHFILSDNKIDYIKTNLFDLTN